MAFRLTCSDEFGATSSTGPGGPMTLRFVLQPVMATIAALHDGIKDARRGRTPYLWTILTNSEKRGARLQEGLIATSRTILMGLVHGWNLSGRCAQDLLSG
jgi:hypothetical protein